MSVDNNTTKTSFFQKVGNWWNKNGNTVGKGMQIAGTTAMGVGVTGMFIDAMNKPSSIFGGCYSPYGMMGMGGCCSPFGMMGMNGSLFGMGGFGGCSTSIAANSAFQYGVMLAMQRNMMSNMQAQQLGINPNLYGAQNQYFQNYIQNPYSFNFSNNTTNTEAEEDNWDNTKVDFEGMQLKSGEGDKKAGEIFDLKTKALYTNGEKVKVAEEGQSVKEGLTATGKNLVAHLDNNSDGFVDESEYIANEKGVSIYNEENAKRAFSKIDLNNDNKLDWTELAAVNGTFTIDKNSKDNTIKKEITQDNYKYWSQALGSQTDSKVVKTMTSVRKWLMGES